MHSWQWRTWEELPYLTCSLLEPWSHGFFTRQFWQYSLSELTNVLQSEAEAYRLKQVHGNLVLTCSEVRTQESEGEEVGRSGDGERKEGREVGRSGDGETGILMSGTSPHHPIPLSPHHPITPSPLASADGLITQQALQAVWVASADCTPVLIADLGTGQVAAVHSGWRGTAMKIVPQAIARLQAGGSKIQNLRIALGPAIAGCVYQVSEQVASEVGSSIISESPESEILDSLFQLSESPVLPDSHPGRVRLDIRRMIALQLEQLGISPEQVAIAPHCTYQEPESFFSYRRDKLKKVQWSGIVSKNSS